MTSPRSGSQASRLRSSSWDGKPTSCRASSDSTTNLLAEAGKDVEWVSYDDDLHGYIYPMRGADGEYDLHGAKVEAIAFIIDYLDRHLQPESS